jgi:hypothetical protein
MLLDGAPMPLLDTSLNISSFGEDEAGELYVVGLGGAVYRIKNPTPPPPPSPDFQIGTALVRKRANGNVLQPVTVRPNGKKFEVVIAEMVAAPVPQSVGASVQVNGAVLEASYTVNEIGMPIFVARLKRFMLADRHSSRRHALESVEDSNLAGTVRSKKGKIKRAPYFCLLLFPFYFSLFTIVDSYIVVRSRSLVTLKLVHVAALFLLVFFILATVGLPRLPLLARHPSLLIGEDDYSFRLWEGKYSSCWIRMTTAGPIKSRHLPPAFLRRWG